MSEQKLGLFNGEDKPTVEVAWEFFEKGCEFNDAINLNDTVKTNENFYVGKQWEGVMANGLPTPVFNMLKRVVGFVTATITTENLKANATAFSRSLNTASYKECVRIVNEECDSLMSHNEVPALVRELARNAAVDGDGCIYTYWDPTVNMGDGISGAIKSECIENTRVFFGNPNDRRVQTQPYIQVMSRELARSAKIRAKRYGSSDWEQIMPDEHDEDWQEDVLRTDDKVTVLLTMWRDDETGEIWAYESTHDAEIRAPWSMGIRKYPLVWFNWDYIQDSYHGQAMITGLIPNQIFVNKAYAMSMLSMMRTAWPKVVYDNTRVRKWDNRVGGAIGVTGDVNTVAKILDPAQISPQIAQFIQMAIEQTEESLGATASALGEGKAYNTSAILSLQRAAATPTEMIKQNLYRCVEQLFYIYIEFMAEYYGVRKADMPTPPEVRQTIEQYNQLAMETGQPTQEIPEEVPQDFDFGILKDQPFLLKVDVGGSAYYSEIAAMQTIDKMLELGQITKTQYVERVPDSYIPDKQGLLKDFEEEIKKQEVMQQMAMLGMPMMPPPDMAGGSPEPPQAGVGNNPEETIAAQIAPEPEISGGRGYGAAARRVNGEA